MVHAPTTDGLLIVIEKGLRYFPITPQLFVALADILDRSVTSGIIHLSGEEPLRDTLCFHKQTNGEDWRSF